MKKILKVAGIVLLVLSGLWLILFLWPVREQKDYPYFEREGHDPLVIAHAGGKALAPEGTLEVFEASYNAGADILEYDTHITSDGHLVVMHDNTVDRTTDGSGVVNEMTLDEIKELDAGYTYIDNNGEHSYRDRGLEVATVEEVLQDYPDTRHLIELKATNHPDVHEAMIQEMWRLIQDNNMEENVLIASFDHSINERFQEISDGQVPIGAGENEITPFVIKHVLGLNGLADLNANAIQLPIEQYGIDLTNRNLLRGAADRNIDIHYWTINDEETMKELIEKEVDGIMTDKPNILIDLIEEYEREQ